MTKIELISKQVIDQLEEGNYFRIYELLEYHYNIEDVQEYVANLTRSNQTGNSARACYNNLMRYFVSECGC